MLLYHPVVLWTYCKCDNVWEWSFVAYAGQYKVRYSLEKGQKWDYFTRNSQALYQALPVSELIWWVIFIKYWYLSDPS